MTEFWEPWQPEIGTRVRVHIGGECPFVTRGKTHEGQIVESTHREWESGKTGHIVTCRYIKQEGFCEHAMSGPRFVVKYDAPRPDVMASQGHYAAIELEPIDA